MSVPLVLAAVISAAFAGPPVSITVREPAAYRGDATVTVSFIDPERVPARCGAMGAAVSAGTYALACQTGRTLVLPNPCLWPNHSDYQRIVCHELAHANGWPSNHPQDTAQ